MPYILANVSDDVYKAIFAYADRWYNGDINRCVDENLYAELIDTDDWEFAELLKEAGVSAFQGWE